MKKGMIIVTMVFALILGFHLPVFAQQNITPDLRAVPDGKGWKGSINVTKLVEKDGAAAIESTTREDKQNVVWLDGFEFSAGTIEFDGKGQSGPPQSSFVGVAFRVVDAKTHDAVYFRPFNFGRLIPKINRTLCNISPSRSGLGKSCGRKRRASSRNPSNPRPMEMLGFTPRSSSKSVR